MILTIEFQRYKIFKKIHILKCKWTRPPHGMYDIYINTIPLKCKQNKDSYEKKSKLLFFLFNPKNGKYFKQNASKKIMKKKQGEKISFEAKGKYK